jgi:hypothetical protein
VKKSYDLLLVLRWPLLHSVDSAILHKDIPDMKFLRNNPFSCIAILLASGILTGIYFLDFNFIDLGLKELLKVENNELEELVTAFLLVIGGLTGDLFRARALAKRRSEIDEQRLLVLKATMRTVQDLVNNFLSSMQLFRMEGEDNPLSPE